MRVQELCRDLYDDSYGWNSLPIAIKSSILDIGRVSLSTAGTE